MTIIVHPVLRLYLCSPGYRQLRRCLEASLSNGDAKVAKSHEKTDTARRQQEVGGRLGPMGYLEPVT